jgi:hypothetical protein
MAGKEKAEKEKSKSERAYELFDQQFGPSDPEVKHVIPSSGTRRNYFFLRKKTEGLVIVRLKNCISSTTSQNVT